MTPAEFKAWFDGFTEAFTGCPTKAQWARIKERVAEIDGKPVTERHFIDRYWPTYHPYYYSTPTILSGTVTGPTTGGTWTIAGASDTVSFSSTNAMYALGKADSASLS